METEYGVYVLVIGLMILILGTIHGRVRKSSVLDLGLMVRNHTFALTITMTFIFFFIQMSIISSCSYYLQVSTLSDALLFAMYINLISTVLQMVFSPIFGRISCKVDKRVLPVGSMVLMVMASALCIIKLDEGNAHLLILIMSILTGISSAAFMGPNTSRVMSCVATEDRPTASALLTFFKQSSKIVGSLLFVEIAFALHKSTELETYTTTVELLGVVCIVLALIGTYLSFKGPKEYKE